MGKKKEKGQVGMSHKASGRTSKEGQEGRKVRRSLCCPEQEVFCRRSLCFVCLFAFLQNRRKNFVSNEPFNMIISVTS